MSCGNCGSVNCSGCVRTNCTTCGGINCGCKSNVTCSQVAGVIPAGIRACSPLAGCGNVLSSSVTPFYNQASQCQENNCQQVNIISFCPTVKNDNAFNMPACGQQATFVSSELSCAIQVGSYLWSDTYGYLEVVAFDNNTKQVTIQNNCNEDNAAPGTKITACSEFTNVDPPPPEINPNDRPCLAIDFTAPDVGDCIDITVTNTNGLQVGYLVTIGSGVYRVDGLVSATVITICNDGEGITPGTPVIALNASGDFQYCFGIISVNPCEEDPVDEGTVLVCNEGVIRPLNDGDDNDILTLVDATNNIAQWQPPAVVDPCGDYQNETAIYTLVGVNSNGSIIGNPAAEAPGPYTASYTLTSNQFMISNPSTCRTMRGMYQFDYVVNLKYFLEDTDGEATCLTALYSVELQISIDGGAFANEQVWSSVGFENQPLCDLPFVFNYAWGGSFSGQINLLPAAGTTFQARLVFTYVTPAVASLQARMEVLTSTEISGTALTVAV